MDRKIELAPKDNVNSYFIYAFVIFVVLIGLYFCLVGRGGVHLFGDEFHTIVRLYKPYSELATLYDDSGSGIALPLMQRFAVDLFGKGLWAYRLPALLGAIATLLMIYPAASRMVGQVPAMITALALSANAMHIYYSRFGRSYSMMVFLIILLVYAVNRAISQDKSRPFWYIIATLCTGLAPYVHLTAVASVVGIGIAAVIVLWIQKRIGRHWYWLVSSFIIGILLCVGLYLPAWESLWYFIKLKAGKGYLESFGAMDVISLLAGNRQAAIVWLFGVPAAAIWILIKKRSDAILLAAAAIAPVLAITLTHPMGMAYAYARYLLTALPFILMLLAWFLVELLRSIHLPKPNVIGLVVGSVLVLVSFLVGPLGFKHTEDGPFANMYLSMMPLPAFDVPWDQTPPFYKTLSESTEAVRIIEVPELLCRSAHLYRNYYLQHRKEVLIGFICCGRSNIPGGPYVWPFNLNAVQKSNADYLILHLNVEWEVAQYWRFVYNKVWPAIESSDTQSLMIRQSQYTKPFGQLYRQADYLQEIFGEPVYKDTTIVVWKLKPSGAETGN